MKQEYKFERLEVWQLSVELLDLVYAIDKFLPPDERFNLSSQMKRAATSVSLNIVEGSTTASDPQKLRYLTIALHSYIETYACYLLILRRKYLNRDNEICINFEEKGAKLFAKLQSFIKVLKK